MFPSCCCSTRAGEGGELTGTARKPMVPGEEKSEGKLEAEEREGCVFFFRRRRLTPGSDNSSTHGGKAGKEEAGPNQLVLRVSEADWRSGERRGAAWVL